jgi:hypothetical protein
MSLIISIALTIFLFFIYLKFLFPFLYRFSGSISNSSIKKFLNYFPIVLMLFTSILPVFIIKFYPKSREQANKHKFDSYRNKAFEFQKKGNYTLAYQFFDSAENHSVNSLEFHTEKSQMKHFNGDSKSAIEIINILIKENEKNNIYNYFDYECRSMYYFSLNDYEGAIADLQIAMKIDSLSNVDRKLQISLMYLLSNNLDSSLYYLNMALGDISGMHEYDLEEFLKESNLLNALIHYKMENLNAACIYFQEYNKFNNVEIYTNYLPEFFAQRDLSGTTLYRDLFRIDMEHLTNVCK